MKAVTKFVAFDDQEFDTAEACKAYEAEHVEARLVGLSIEQVRAAVAGDDPDLRDALEEIGRRCGNARREAGDFRRKTKAMRGGGAPPEPVAAGAATAPIASAPAAPPPSSVTPTEDATDGE